MKINAGTDTSTLVDRFLESLRQRPDATAITLVDQGLSTRFLSYRDLDDAARAAASGLRAAGLDRGDRVIVALATSVEILGLYLAAQGTGIVPLIAPPPCGPRVSHRHAAQLRILAHRIDARGVIVNARNGEALAGSGVPVIEVESLFASGTTTLEPPAPDDIAHLQMTSGSTGKPKVAGIRHRNIAANTAAIGSVIGERNGDRIVSWLPLHHDMGLICFACALTWQRPLVLTDSRNFVRHPIRYWLELLSRFEGTVSPAPTSAYQTCARLAHRRRFRNLDLSTWRVAFCGAEPVLAATLSAFHDAFAPYGLSRQALLPVYGLAEATLAVSIPSPDETRLVDRIDRRAVASGHARRVDARSDRVREIVAMGPPIPGHGILIVGDDGQPLPERSVGEILVTGPSVIDTYVDGTSCEDPRRADGALPTGDLGYVAGGQLHVVGRKKDIIVYNGRNLYPHDIEELVAEELKDIGRGRVAAIGAYRDDFATEELYLVVESREGSAPARIESEERIRAAVVDAFEAVVTRIAWVDRGAIPTTSSGKIQRYRCRDFIGALSPENEHAPPTGLSEIA